MVWGKCSLLYILCTSPVHLYGEAPSTVLSLKEASNSSNRSTSPLIHWYLLISRHSSQVSAEICNIHVNNTWFLHRGYNYPDPHFFFDRASFIPCVQEIISEIGKLTFKLYIFNKKYLLIYNLLIHASKTPHKKVWIELLFSGVPTWLFQICLDVTIMPQYIYSWYFLREEILLFQIIYNWYKFDIILTQLWGQNLAEATFPPRLHFPHVTLSFMFLC